MVTHIEGGLLAGDASFAIVVSRVNLFVTERLLAGALDTFRRHGADDDRVTVVRVPGAFEIPMAAERLAAGGRFSAIVCLGAVIQGETSHHDYINHQTAAGIGEVGRKHSIPVTFGVLTCQTMEQALQRAGGKAGNKGCDAALAAIEMVNVLAVIDRHGS